MKKIRLAVLVLGGILLVVGIATYLISIMKINSLLSFGKEIQQNHWYFILVATLVSIRFQKE